VPASAEQLVITAATKTDRSPAPPTANREVKLIESDRKRDIPGGGCREDARVHYEGINVQARRIALVARATVRTRGP
jgi:hypothetical protein